MPGFKLAQVCTRGTMELRAEHKHSCFEFRSRFADLAACLDGGSVHGGQQLSRLSGQVCHLPGLPPAPNGHDLRPKASVNIRDLAGNELRYEHIGMILKPAANVENGLRERMRPP
jgi:hypothetical protein